MATGCGRPDAQRFNAYNYLPIHPNGRYYSPGELTLIKFLHNGTEFREVKRLNNDTCNVEKNPSVADKSSIWTVKTFSLKPNTLKFTPFLALTVDTQLLSDKKMSQNGETKRKSNQKNGKIMKKRNSTVANVGVWSSSQKKLDPTTGTIIRKVNWATFYLGYPQVPKMKKLSSWQRNLSSWKHVLQSC